MKSLRVRARLANGYVCSDPWSPSLDGMLAYLALRDSLSDEDFAMGATTVDRIVVVEDLPLGKEKHNGDWWWQCSSPIIDDSPVRFAKFYHRRFDFRHAIDLVPARKVETKAGPFKSYRLRDMVTVVPHIDWHCVGDKERIEKLLERCTFVGRGQTRGMGQVLSWEATENGDESLARFHRPLPVEFAAAHDVEGHVTRWGIIPPGRLPAHQRECVMPWR